MVKWLCLSLIFLFQGVRVYALTLLDLRTQCRFYLRDTASDPARQRFFDSQLNTLLNNAQREVNNRIWAIINSTSISLISGTTEYLLPTDYIFPLRVTVNHIPIPERSLSFLDDSGNNWVQDSTGVPREYYIKVSSPLVAGAIRKESIGVHPTSSGTMTMTIDYLSQVTEMSASGDIPFGADNRRLYDTHYVLAYYVSALGFMAMGMKEDAMFYFNLYNSMVLEMESINKTRLLYNPNFRGSEIFKQRTQSGGQQ